RSLAPSPPCTHTLPLHDALPILQLNELLLLPAVAGLFLVGALANAPQDRDFASFGSRLIIGTLVAPLLLLLMAVLWWLVTQRRRSEEHTSELQSRENLVCRLLLE